MSSWPRTLCSHHKLVDRLPDGTERISEACDVDALKGALWREGIPPQRVGRLLWQGGVIGGYVPAQPIDDLIEIHEIPLHHYGARDTVGHG